MTLAFRFSSILFIIIISQLPFRMASQSDLKDNDNSATCDIDHCDTIVNKCLITKRCSSTIGKDAHSIKDCIDCLEEKFGKCCDCVGLCPRPNKDIESSHVGLTLNDKADQDFFEVLTETDDLHGRWSVEKISKGILLMHPEHGQIEVAYRKEDNNITNLSHDNNLVKKDCTVAFINTELSTMKCKQYCTSMGARYFRWFYGGCCECIGEYCFNYGVNEPKCNINYDD